MGQYIARRREIEEESKARPSHWIPSVSGQVESAFWIIIFILFSSHKIRAVNSHSSLQETVLHALPQTLLPLLKRVGLRKEKTSCRCFWRVFPTCCTWRVVFVSHTLNDSGGSPSNRKVIEIFVETRKTFRETYERKKKKFIKKKNKYFLFWVN